MSEETWKCQLSLKFGQRGALLNLRGDSPQEVAELAQEAESVAEAFVSVDSVLTATAGLNVPEPAVTTGTPASVASGAPTTPLAKNETVVGPDGVERCMHGPLEIVRKKDNTGVWKFCPLPRGSADRCFIKA